MGERGARIDGGANLSSMFFEVYTRERDWLEFQSTCRRLNPFFHSVMKLTLGSVQGIDFRKLITDGWVILVNLYPIGVFEILKQLLCYLAQLSSTGRQRPQPTSRIKTSQSTATRYRTTFTWTRSGGGAPPPPSAICCITGHRLVCE